MTTHVKLTPSGDSSAGPVLLKSAAGILKTDRGNITANILFDEGAQRTFITEDTVKRLNIANHHCRKETVSLSAFGENTANLRRLNVVDLQLETRKGVINLSALVVPTVSSLVTNHVHAVVAKYPYLKNLPLANHVQSSSFEIDLLVGADYYWSIVENHVVRGPGPTAVASKLGYLLSGPTNIHHLSVMNTLVCKVLTSTSDLEHQVVAYWDLETLGITDDPGKQACSYKTYSDTQLYTNDEGKYVAGLPWKRDHPPLPTNYNISAKRTRTLVRRLDPPLLATCDGILKDQLQHDFIEQVHGDNPAEGHYIPHRPVQKESKTTPIRIVYDCSCKERDQPSLNDCLETGPPLLNDMVKILLRFRLHTVAFSSDIEKAFLNIQLKDSDRDFTKFLWLSDPKNPESDFNVYRFKSVLFGAVSSPFILNAVLKAHLESHPSDITRDLQQNIYVDNLISGVNDVKQAIQYFQNSVKVLAQAGFTLRCWSTNDCELQRHIGKENRLEVATQVKTLGMLWETQRDVLSYLPNLQQTIDPLDPVNTKREVVRFTSSVFDPLGFLAPVLIQAKTFIQKLWQDKLPWDQPLSEDLTSEWQRIQREIMLTQSYVVDRRYFFTEPEKDNFELHVFADASSRAYGAVIYLKNGTQTSFIIAKSRVKPLKPVTIPRLELLAAFLAARLVTFVKSALSNLGIHTIVLWSDSQTVLHWICSNKKLPLFVENRVKVIKETGFTHTRYCPTKENPADLLTRGITYQELQDSGLWSHGPTWLPQGDWPVCQILNVMYADSITDEQTCIELTTPVTNTGVNTVIDGSRYNSLAKLHRVTAYVLRCVDILKHRPHATSTHVTIQELRVAAHTWITAIQHTGYVTEIQALERHDGKQPPLVRQLKLFLDPKGLLRCGGRLHNAFIL